MQYIVAQYSTVQYNVAQYSEAHCSTVHYSTLQYSVHVSVGCMRVSASVSSYLCAYERVLVYVILEHVRACAPECLCPIVLRQYVRARVPASVRA